MRNALLLSIAALGLTAAAPASAEGDTRSVPVEFTDLDLSKPADEAQLRSRIRRAARVACDVPGERGLAAMQAFNTCWTAALNTANPRAERAIAAARNGGSAEVKTARR